MINAWHLMHANASLMIYEKTIMVNRFILKSLFPPEVLTKLVQNFGFIRMSEPEISHAIQGAFTDYILAALSENSSDTEDNQKIYIEAAYHLTKATKLLEAMPHPAGKMAYRLDAMTTTLNKLIEGETFAAERATRFMEKNLVRRLRDIWVANTATPFHTGSDNTGRNPKDFLLQCFAAAGREYPEVTWFKQVDEVVVNQLIKSIKR